MDMGLGWGKTWLNMFNQFYAKLIIELTTIIKIITTYMIFFIHYLIMFWTNKIFIYFFKMLNFSLKYLRIVFSCRINVPSYLRCVLLNE